jgi:hypothetical protein
MCLDWRKEMIHKILLAKLAEIKTWKITKDIVISARVFECKGNEILI